ncbi:MAG: hypothetical protein ACYDAI_04965 [Trichloromonadaceae bacterium]
MLNLRPTIWLILLLALAGTLFSAKPGFCLPEGKSCLAAWQGEGCDTACAQAALLPKPANCPNCHHYPGLPLPLKHGADLLNPNKRLDQTSFVSLQSRPDATQRRLLPPLLLQPRRPQLPNHTLAALRTVVLRN